MAKSPDDEDDVRKDLQRALKELDNSIAEYEKRQSYYDGVVGEFIAHPTLKALLAKYGEGFGLNYACIPADALIDRVDLQGLRTGDKATDDKLKKDLWDANDLDDGADDFHLKAAYLGDYYAIEWPRPAEEDDDTDSPEVIEVIGKHPTQARIVYSRENSRIALFGISRWREGIGNDARWRVNLFYDDAIHEFESDKAPSSDSPTAGVRAGTTTGGNDQKDYSYVQAGQLGSDGEPLQDETGDEVIGDAITFHEYGFPMHHFRPDSKPYGTPVNIRAYGPQDAITKINATAMAALDYQGFPQRYALMDPLAEEGDDIDDDFLETGAGTVDGDDRHTEVSGGSKLSNVPGGLWMLRGLKGAGQFDSGDPKNFLEPEEFQIRAAATLTRTPLYEFSLDEGGVPSGEARRRADGPINKHAKKVMGSYGQPWSGVGMWALRYWGLTASKRVEAVWLPSEVGLDKDGLLLVASKVEQGVTPRQALLEAGYTDDQLDSMGLAETNEGDGYLSQMTPALLSSISVSLKNLAAATTLAGDGSIPADKMTEMLARIFGTFTVDEPAAPVVPVLDPATGLPVLAPAVPPVDPQKAALAAANAEKPPVKAVEPVPPAPVPSKKAKAKAAAA